ncbi:glycosyl transferase family 2 [Cytophagales bacterium WSM2-2]|nr:glycosyl transferase family 2 [Cytophagales bacterium WSM2-2]
MTFTIIGLAALGVQIIYLAMLALAFHKANYGRSTETLPGVSVIVCAHDEEQNLRELVPALLTQECSEFEVIIVEDRCNDGTYDYLLQATKEDERLKMVRVTQKPEHINGKKFALTLGIKAARYDWVLLTDADCRPAGNQWITSMMGDIQPQTKIVLGFSPYFKTGGLLNSFVRFESFLTGIQFIGFALMGKPYMGVGRNLAYRKELFLENKGFNSHLGVTGGDDDLFVNQHATRENTQVRIGSEAVMRSIAKTKWSDYLHQKFRHLSVGKRYKFVDKLLLTLFSLSLFLTWFLVVPAIFLSPWANSILIVFVVRIILMMILFHSLPRKLGDSFETWKTPFLDFMYVFYYLGTGAKALFAKKVKWKN